MRPKLKIPQRGYPNKENPIINSKAIEEPISMIEDVLLNYTLEEEMIRNSCIAPEAGDTESAKEKDERNILDEPMVAKALKLFNPKRVRVQRNS